MDNRRTLYNTCEYIIFALCQYIVAKIPSRWLIVRFSIGYNRLLGASSVEKSLVYVQRSSIYDNFLDQETTSTKKQCLTKTCVTKGFFLSKLNEKILNSSNYTSIIENCDLWNKVGHVSRSFSGFRVVRIIVFSPSSPISFAAEAR